MKSAKQLMSVTLLLLALSSLAYAEHGDGTRGGGDAVLCRNEPSVSPFVGYYALDFVMASWPKYLVPYKTSAEALDHMIAVLDQKSPDLKNDLVKFRSQYDQGTNLENKPQGKDLIQWKPANNGLTFLDDQKLLPKMPENCYEVDPKTGQKLVLQAVIKEKKARDQIRPNDIVNFLWDPKTIAKLRARDAQESWIVIHEFARNYTNDPEVIREFNEYLHSTDLDNDNEDDMAAAFTRYGVGNFRTLTKYKADLAAQKAHDDRLAGEFKGVITGSIYAQDRLDKVEKAFNEALKPGLSCEELDKRGAVAQKLALDSANEIAQMSSKMKTYLELWAWDAQEDNLISFGRVRVEEIEQELRNLMKDKLAELMDQRAKNGCPSR